jgi:hypothetical protein
VREGGTRASEVRARPGPGAPADTPALFVQESTSLEAACRRISPSCAGRGHPRLPRHASRRSRGITGRAFVFDEIRNFRQVASKIVLGPGACGRKSSNLAQFVHQRVNDATPVKGIATPGLRKVTVLAQLLHGSSQLLRGTSTRSTPEDAPRALRPPWRRSSGSSLLAGLPG